MKMLCGNLLIKPLTKEQLGKIILPDSVEDDWQRGEVIAIDETDEKDIKVGDIAVFRPAPSPDGRYPTIGNHGYIVVPSYYIWAIEN